jgi:hypothetical protein
MYSSLSCELHFLKKLFVFTYYYHNFIAQVEQKNTQYTYAHNCTYTVELCT